MARARKLVPIANGRPFSDRVRSVATDLGCTILWTRPNGPHVLLGLGGDEAFARVTPLGGDAFGLSFRSPEPAPKGASDDAAAAPKWQPMLLVDDLPNVVEHALVAERALPLRAAGM